MNPQLSTLWPSVFSVVLSCGPLSSADPAFWEPVRDSGIVRAGSGGAAGETDGAPPAEGGAGASGAPSEAGEEEVGGPSNQPATRCSLEFSVTTVTAKGRYAPRNVGAIWVSHSGGQFVKTLRAWGTVRLHNATAWTTVSDSNAVDAVTSATRADHGALDAAWDCTDTAGAVVPASEYQLSVTFAEDNASVVAPPPLHVATVNFNTVTRPLELAAPDQPNFAAVRLIVR